MASSLLQGYNKIGAAFIHPLHTHVRTTPSVCWHRPPGPELTLLTGFYMYADQRLQLGECGTGGVAFEEVGLVFGEGGI